MSILQCGGHPNRLRSEMRPAGDMRRLHCPETRKNIHSFFFQLLKQPSATVENKPTFIHPHCRKDVNTSGYIYTYIHI